MTVAGGCRCGAVRYELAVDALPPVYACHCHQCQRWTGSAFSLQALVPEQALSISGPVEVYEKTTDDRTSTQRICGTCRSRLYNTNTRRPGVAVVRAGTLDDSERLDCRAHIYIAYKQDWVILPDGIPTFEEAAPAAEFLTILTRSW
ncbi:Aldehyde-activating protein [Sphingomonas sp. EC-HK361]|uniref:GFA family protein n=1 Tax=Sphingomonas sp. EC-HK361 TaxID=2038397 RepID=UPI0012545F4D|nr:GFA family protein [Sphingomonas sp. EC-HK361]VVT03603.1 Aldehyde-activating protein [Sphingomonas sp. EC-HK361]